MMMTVLADKEELIGRIVTIELAMFSRVKAVEPAACQQMPETFRTMRRMSHSALSTDTLASYLQDLQSAVTQGRNLVTEKYARMDNLIPPINRNPLIKSIVALESFWLRDLHERFPLAVRCDGRFEVYALGELETYSDQTLALYFRDVESAVEAGGIWSKSATSICIRDSASPHWTKWKNARKPPRTKRTESKMREQICRILSISKRRCFAA
jgi:hypothetical protein